MGGHYANCLSNRAIEEIGKSKWPMIVIYDGMNFSAPLFFFTRISILLRLGIHTHRVSFFFIIIAFLYIFLSCRIWMCNSNLLLNLWNFVSDRWNWFFGNVELLDILVFWLKFNKWFDAPTYCNNHTLSHYTFRSLL